MWSRWLIASGSSLTISLQNKAPPDIDDSGIAESRPSIRSPAASTARGGCEEQARTYSKELLFPRITLTMELLPTDSCGASFRCRIANHRVAPGNAGQETVIATLLRADLEQIGCQGLWGLS